MTSKFADRWKIFSAVYENGCLAKSVNAEFLWWHNSFQVDFHLYICIPRLLKVHALRNLFMQF